MLYGLSHKDMAVQLHHMQPVYTELKKGTKMWEKVDLHKFLEVLFVHLDIKHTYSICKDKLYSLCFITNRLLFIKEIFKFVKELFTFVVKAVLKIKYPHKNSAVLNPGLGI